MVLPLLPLQILLNNLLYDISEITLPLDHVDAEAMEHPKGWDMDFVRNFMLTIGLIRSVFDFLTFYILLRMFTADRSLIRKGWFAESMATQVLVIFVIRTRRVSWRSCAHPWLAATSLGVATAIALPFTSIAPHLGFTPLPGAFFAVLGVLLVAYLARVELGKQWFYRHDMRRA